MADGLTDALAGWVLDTRLEDMPDTVVSRYRDMMLNGVGIAIATAGMEEADTMLGLARSMGGTADCTLIGSDLQTSPLNAALVNGTLVHLLDFDEVVLRRANHPTNVMLPTVMALGEQLHRSGHDVLEAFAIGCEVSTKLGAIGDLDETFTTLDHRGWHVEGVAGAIGAAATAGRLLGLSREQLRNAIGIAVSQASGVQANFGTSTKSLHCGLAAMHGILSATLAAQGFTGNPRVLEVQGGFLDCYRGSTEIDADEFIGRLGAPYDVIDPGVGLKFYPCGSALHTAIDLAVKLTRENRLRPEDVAGIHVSWPGLPRDKLAGFGKPTTGLQAKFSMIYVMAVAIAYGPPTLAHFRDEAVGDPVLDSLMDRVTSSTDEIPTPEASRPATVTITLTDGRELRAHAAHALGHPDNPMTVAQLDAKFTGCATGVFDDAEIAGLIAGLRGIETAPDAADLFSLLRRPAHA